MSLYCDDNFVISLELSCIYRNFNSRLRVKIQLYNTDDRICPVSTSNKLPGTLGAEGIARVSDASLVRSKRRKDNTKAWLEGNIERESWRQDASRPQFLDFQWLGGDNWPRQLHGCPRSNFNSGGLKSSERGEEPLGNVFLDS